jgi:hypothetical protein
MDISLDRLGALVDQFDQSREIAQERLSGLSDEEYLWEPVPGMWSVRRRAEAVSSQPLGVGDWVLDNEQPPPEPPPLTTIAWRIGHLTSGLAGRWEYTFGERSAAPDTIVEFSDRADDALATLWRESDAWRAGLVSLTDEQLEVPGYGQYPYGFDPHLPFLGIVWWVNREVIHHLAEVALLRDLYRAHFTR